MWRWFERSRGRCYLNTTEGWDEREQQKSEAWTPLVEWTWRDSWRGDSLKQEKIAVATSEDRRGDGRLGAVDFLVAHHGHGWRLTRCSGRSRGGFGFSRQ